jgi:hypothetical protein
LTLTNVPAVRERPTLPVGGASRRAQTTGRFRHRLPPQMSRRRPARRCLLLRSGNQEWTDRHRPRIANSGSGSKGRFEVVADVPLNGRDEVASRRWANGGSGEAPGKSAPDATKQVGASVYLDGAFYFPIGWGADVNLACPLAAIAGGGQDVS